MRTVGELTALLGVVAWPAVVLIGLVLFRRVIRDVLSRDDLAFSGPGGISFSARRAAGALVEASSSKTTGAPVSQDDAEDQVHEVTAFVRRLGRSPRLLWVDDHPSHNRWERAAIENMGMTIDLSVSTEDAQQKLRQRGAYDVILSDMDRPEDPRAGYVLLKWLRDRQDMTPYIIYSASSPPEHFDEAVRQGALGSTSRPQDLVDMILRALRDARPRRRWWRPGG